MCQEQLNRRNLLLMSYPPTNHGPRKGTLPHSSQEQFEDELTSSSDGFWGQYVKDSIYQL